MKNDSRPSEMPHRLFRDARFLEARSQAPIDQDDLSESITAAITMIEKATELYDGMQETVRLNEETIYNQNNEIAHLNSQKEDAFDKLLQLEEICRSEADRAAKAETQSLSLGSRLKTLEKRNADLAAQLDRMIQTVSRSFAKRADIEVFAKPPLRAVI